MDRDAGNQPPKVFLSSPENPRFDPPPLASEAQAPIVLIADPFPPPQLQPIPPAPRAGENPVWRVWDVLLIAGLTVLTLLITQLLVAPGVLRFAYPHTSWLDVAQKPVSALLAQLLTYLVVALYMILLVEGNITRVSGRPSAGIGRGSSA